MRNLFTICTCWLLLVGMASAQTPSRHFQELQHQSHRPAATQKAASHDDSPLLRTDYEWNDNLAQWDSAGRATWAFYPNGNVAEYIYEIFDTTGFVPWVKEALTYNSQNLESTFISSSWDGSNWVLSWMDELTYDLHDNLTLIMEYNWNGASWDSAFAESTAYTYVFTNKVSSQIYQEWDSNNPVWTNLYKDEYTWPTAAAWDTQTSSEWNGASWDYTGRNVDVIWHDFAQYEMASERTQSYLGSTWGDDSRDTYTYGPNDSYVQLTEIWNGSSWDMWIRQIRDIDAHDHITAIEDYRWTGTWDLLHGMHITYNYDGLGRTLHEMYEYADTGSYTMSELKVYGSFFTEAPEPASLSAQVTAFPNPCTDKLNFKLELPQNSPLQIALYDLQGRLRMQTASPRLIDSQVTMPISEVLENGTYVYRVSTKEGVAEGKVVVQR